MKNKIKRTDLVYPDLSFKIVGVLFEVHNQLGGSHKEKYYYNSIKVLLEKNKISYKEQIIVPLLVNDKKVGKYILDFLVEDKIVLEIKAGDHFRREYINQVYSYLVSTNLKLGILANFTQNSLQYKRIVNIK